MPKASECGSALIQGDALILCSYPECQHLFSEPLVLRGKLGPGMASCSWRLDATNECDNPAQVCYWPAHLRLVGSQPTAAAWPRGTSTFDAYSCTPGVHLFWEWACSILLIDSGLLVHSRSSSPTLRTSWRSIRIFWQPWSTAYTPSLSLSTNLGMFS